jgi:hypothetical protein
MITYCQIQVEEFYIGITKKIVVKKARTLINQWHEYLDYSDNEIIKMAKQEQCEFDLVKINADWSSHKNNKKFIIALYEYKYNQQIPPRSKPELKNYL